jgi:hypothetical protein
MVESCTAASEMAKILGISGRWWWILGADNNVEAEKQKYWAVYRTVVGSNSI